VKTTPSVPSVLRVWACARPFSQQPRVETLDERVLQGLDDQPLSFPARPSAREPGVGHQSQTRAGAVATAVRTEGAIVAELIRCKVERSAILGTIDTVIGPQNLIRNSGSGFGGASWVTARMHWRRSVSSGASSWGNGRCLDAGPAGCAHPEGFSRADPSVDGRGQRCEGRRGERPA